MRFALLNASLLALLGSAQPAFAAGVTCSQPSTYPERTICADAQLSRQDERVQAFYNAAMLMVDDPALLKDEQDEWRAERDRCTDSACISQAQEARIDLLLGIACTYADIHARRSPTAGL